MRAPRAWKKSAAQFGLPLTPAIERRFRRSTRSLTKTPDANSDPAERVRSLKLRRSTAGAADRGGAPGGAARPKQTIPARGRSVARAAPGARTDGNIRSRGAATTLAPPGASFPCLVLLAWLSSAWRGVDDPLLEITRMPTHRETASACIFFRPARPSPNDRDVV
jgi:hypothetical protein